MTLPRTPGTGPGDMVHLSPEQLRKVDRLVAEGKTVQQALDIVNAEVFGKDVVADNRAARRQR